MLWIPADTFEALFKKTKHIEQWLLKSRKRGNHLRKYGAKLSSGIRELVSRDLRQTKHCNTSLSWSSLNSIKRKINKMSRIQALHLKTDQLVRSRGWRRPLTPSLLPSDTLVASLLVCSSLLHKAAQPLLYNFCYALWAWTVTATPGHLRSED